MEYILKNRGEDEVLMKRYPPERKEAVLKKMLPPPHGTIAALAMAKGISKATLYT